MYIVQCTCTVHVALFKTCLQQFSNSPAGAPPPPPRSYKTFPPSLGHELSSFQILFLLDVGVLNLTSASPDILNLTSASLDVLSLTSAGLDVLSLTSASSDGPYRHEADNPRDL